MKPAPVVEMRDVEVFVSATTRDDPAGRAYLLQGINWTVRAGEHWVVLGPNGAGKTTLCSIASARRHPSRGSVVVLGGQLGRVDVWMLYRHIGLVDWRLDPPPHLLAAEVVASGLTGASQPRHWDPDVGDACAAALSLVAAEDLGTRFFGTLSRGEQARVLIARALVGQPDMLVLDEPAVGLDLPGREDLLAVLARLARERPAIATVVVVHLLEEIPPTVTHAILLQRGRVLAAGRVGEVLCDALLSACYDRQLSVRHGAGRWSAVSAEPQAG